MAVPASAPGGEPPAAAAGHGASTFLSLQLLRAVAAWLVVFHHVMQLVYGSRSETVVGRFFADHGAFGVNLFFVLSGVVMYFSARHTGPRSVHAFMVDRLARIVPAYWLYTLATVLLLALIPDAMAGTAYTAWTLLASLLFVPTANPSGLGVFPTLTVGWTLNFEMFFYLLLTGCLALSKRFGPLLAVIALLLIPLLYPKDLPYAAVASRKLLYQFAAGMVLAWIWQAGSLRQRSGSLSPWLTVPSAVAVVFAIASIPHDDVRMLLLPTSIVAAVMLMEPVARAWRQRIAWPLMLGNVSYSTYLIHPLLIALFIHAFGTDWQGARGVGLVFALSLILVGASLISFRWVEHNPLVEGWRRRTHQRIAAGPVSAAA